MDRKTAQAAITDLRNQLRRHDHLYYVLGRPEISDHQYDLLLQKLGNLESRFPDLITPDSPTQRVGSDLTKTFPKQRHSVPMLSIANTYSEAELRDFDRRVRELLPGEAVLYAVEIKIDGVAVALRYDQGLLQAGVTRGDGETGDVITPNVKTIRSIPLSVERKDPFEVRGEVFMDRKTFHRINEGLPDSARLQNPRNATAGTLKQQDARIVALRGLRFAAYSVIAGDWAVSHSENLRKLQHLGFPTIPHTQAYSTIDEVIAHCRRWEDRRAELDFETDGMVIKVDSLQQQGRLGTTVKSPRWVVAFKYKPVSALTELLAVEPSVGRTGVVTPVAKLRPVLLSGTTVSNAGLYNYDEVERLDLHVPDFVWIEKGGEIIPKVTAVETRRRPHDARPIKPPTHCPVCGDELAHGEAEVALRCENLSCPAQVERSIEHFVGRSSLNIVHIGQALVENLLQANLIKDWADLYFLTQEQLIDLARMGKKSSANVLREIEKSRNAPLDRLIHAIGIRHVGAGTARTLAMSIGNLWDLQGKSQEDLQKLPDIGPVVAQSIHHWFSNPQNIAKLRKLEEAGVQFDRREGLPTSNISSPIAGKTIVVTGTLEKLSRSEVEDLIRKHGGNAASAVSRKTHFLLAGKEAGSKMDKARELNIPILSEEDFLRLLSE